MRAIVSEDEAKYLQTLAKQYDKEMPGYDASVYTVVRAYILRASTSMSYETAVLFLKNAIIELLHEIRGLENVINLRQGAQAFAQGVSAGADMTKPVDVEEITE